MRSRDSLKGVDVKIVSGARAAAREARITKALFEWSLSADALLNGVYVSLRAFPRNEYMKCRSTNFYLFDRTSISSKYLASYETHSTRHDTNLIFVWILQIVSIAFLNENLFKLHAHTHAQNFCMCVCRVYICILYSCQLVTFSSVKCAVLRCSLQYNFLRVHTRINRVHRIHQRMCVL